MWSGVSIHLRHVSMHCIQFRMSTKALLLHAQIAASDGHSLGTVHYGQEQKMHTCANSEMYAKKCLLTVARSYVV